LGESLPSPTLTGNQSVVFDSVLSERPEDSSIHTSSVDAESQDGALQRTLVGIVEANSSTSMAIGRDTTSSTIISRSHSPNAPFSNTIIGSARRPFTPATTIVTPEIRSEHTEIPKQPQQGKPKIKVEYFVVLSRSPVYESKGWQPEGNFQEKTLLQLLRQLPLHGDIKGLIFTLEGPGLKMEQRIDSEDESGFETMKRRFSKMMRVSLASHSDTEKVLIFEIEIESLKEEAIAAGGEDEDTSFLW
jgi:hypothetical protein